VELTTLIPWATGQQSLPTHGDAANEPDFKATDTVAQSQHSVRRWFAVLLFVGLVTVIVFFYVRVSIVSQEIDWTGACWVEILGGQHTVESPFHKFCTP
jgi:hypothetical protein